MELLIDMNLTPRWAGFFLREGWTAVHWSSVGLSNETDRNIISWAFENGYILVTNDLDFPQILAHTRADGPSIILLRGEPLTPEARGDVLIRVLLECALELAQGAIASVDWGDKFRVHLLPLT
jgi:predicted nuclease of predicted toxin-antitoxin system